MLNEMEQSKKNKNKKIKKVVAIRTSAQMHWDLNACNAFEMGWLERTEPNLIHFTWGRWANSLSEIKNAPNLGVENKVFSFFGS